MCRSVSEAELIARYIVLPIYTGIFGAVVCGGATLGLLVGMTKVVDWFERDKYLQQLSTEDIMRKYNDEEKRALLKALKTKYGV